MLNWQLKIKYVFVTAFDNTAYIITSYTLVSQRSLGSQRVKAKDIIHPFSRVFDDI